MTFEYLQRVVVDAELVVDDIGQCVILARNDFGEESYLIVRTELGYTETITYGPVVPDLEILPFSVTLIYNRFEFNQSKIERLIDKFLNDPKRAITQAEVTSYENIKSNIRYSIEKIFLDECREVVEDERDSVGT